MDIPNFYRGRSVLLTGGTGFVGKALLVKLLRCCPEVERVYLLVRDKAGATPKQRIADLLALPEFAGCPTAKVTAVGGDIALPGLGLSDEDRDVLTAHVSVVLHSAATVSFTAKLREALQLNVEAVRRVVQLARDMPELAVTYSNCDRAEVREDVYPPPADLQDLLRLVEEQDDDALEQSTPRIIGGRPNTYTFSKALAESLLAEEAAELPAAIVRPSIVTWGWHDPVPGYTDSANAAIGPLVLIAQGVVRSAMCNPGCVADVVPVDMVVNAILAVSWQTARQRPRAQDAPRSPAPPPVYNCTTGASNPLSWGVLTETFIALARERPPATALWWPACTLTTSSWHHAVGSFLTMTLPAAVFDLVVAPLLEKPATVLKKHWKIQRLMKTLEPFSCNEWDFKDDNMRGLWSQLSWRDRTLFPLDVKAIDWEAYLRAALEGSKHFLLKEGGVDGSRRRLYLLHQLTVAVLTSALFALLGWASWPALTKLWPSSTMKFVKFVMWKC